MESKAQQRLREMSSQYDQQRENYENPFPETLIEKIEETSESLPEPQTEEEKPVFNYKHMGAYVMQKANVEIKDFSLTESIKSVIKALCYYFTQDPEFEKMNPDWKLQKGIYLWGYVGVGKTTIMRLFTENNRLSYNLVNCRQLVANFSKNGYEAIDRYRSSYTGFTTVQEWGMGALKPKGVCFDDLGVDREVVSYGNRTNVMEELLLDRYDNRLPFDQTHITTNLTAEEIELRYGTRVRSRMREMFNLIELHGTDLRK